MKKTRGSIDGPLLAVFFLILMSLVVAAFLAKRWLPPVASEHGDDIDFMISYLLIATGVVFVVGHLVLAVFIFRYRGNKGPEYKQVSRRTEWLWALIPVLCMTVMAEAGVLLIGLPVWAKIYGEPPEDAIVIEVTGKQFEWIVRYPGRIYLDPKKREAELKRWKRAEFKFGTLKPKLIADPDNQLGLDEKDPAAENDLVLTALRIPKGRHVVILLRSRDVLHSFSIAEFRIKQDVIPGYTARTQFTATKTGQYEIACAELCGTNHYSMKSMVYVMEPEEFDKWLGMQLGMYEEYEEDDDE